jgi:hypothetical protein
MRAKVQLYFYCTVIFLLHGIALHCMQTQYCKIEKVYDYHPATPQLTH